MVENHIKRHPKVEFYLPDMGGFIFDSVDVCARWMALDNLPSKLPQTKSSVIKTRLLPPTRRQNVSSPTIWQMYLFPVYVPNSVDFENKPKKLIFLVLSWKEKIHSNFNESYKRHPTANPCSTVNLKKLLKLLVCSLVTFTSCKPCTISHQPVQSQNQGFTRIH